ncbi:unnamed protein product [Echinostoma caproni]|uniref:CCDC92 domain-containing protein n=1 Tax=Echinostoma caproni TaxID=27848 RepID=A0A183A511_9TREM|nr:unnamed protein product [Echinostoma caproni]
MKPQHFHRVYTFDSQKVPQAETNKSPHLANESHSCADPNCLAEMKRLQMETQQLREKLAELQWRKIEAIQNKTSQTSVLSKNSRQQSAVDFAENETVDNKTIINETEIPRSDSSRAKSDRKPAKASSARGSIRSSSRERSRLWDIYSKVAVIPIETDTTPLKYSCGTHHLEKPVKLSADKDSKFVIIPRLTASPKRRQPILETTSLTVLDPTIVPHSPRLTSKSPYAYGERLLNSPKKERVKNVTPTGSHSSIRQPQLTVSPKDTVKPGPRVRVQDHNEIPDNPSRYKLEPSVARVEDQHTDRPIEPKRQRRDQMSELGPVELKVTTTTTNTSMRDPREKQSEVKKLRELRFEKTESHLERVSRPAYASTSTTDDCNPQDQTNTSKLSTAQTLVEKESVL